MDSSIETNPGPPSPRFKPFHYNSQEEKQTFLQIRASNTDLNKIRSHIEFLTNCQKDSLIPNGLRTNVSPATARSNDRVKRKFQNIPENGIKESLNLILHHYKEEIPILTEAKETAVKQLKLLCDEVRFIPLTDELDSFSEKEQKYLDEGKKKKFNNLKLGSTKHPVSAINTGKGQSKNQPGSITVTSQHVEPWIPNLGLTSVEKSFLDNDQDICDKLVDAGMKLLTRDFPQFEYHSSVLDHNHLAFSPHPTIHIHHTGNHHFVTISSTTGQVIIYDSLNLTPPEELFLQLSCLYSPHKEIVPTIYQANISSTQFGSHDCGFLPLPMQWRLPKVMTPAGILSTRGRCVHTSLPALNLESWKAFQKYAIILNLHTLKK